MRRITKMRPSYAGVTATIALVLALGMGGAYAATKIGSKDVAKGAVKSKHVKDESLTGVDVIESSLGEVPEADHAATADSAGSADRADRADRADTADRADAATTAETASAVAPDGVTGASVLDGSLTGTDIDEKTLGLPTAGYELVSSTSPTNSDSPKHVTAKCPEGKRYMTGGYLFGGASSGSSPNAIGNVVVSEYGPNGDGSRILLTAVETNPIAGNWTLSGWAVCVDAR